MLSVPFDCLKEDWTRSLSLSFLPLSSPLDIAAVQLPGIYTGCIRHDIRHCCVRLITRSRRAHSDEDDQRILSWAKDVANSDADSGSDGLAALISPVLRWIWVLIHSLAGSSFDFIEWNPLAFQEGESREAAHRGWATSLRWTPWCLHKFEMSRTHSLRRRTPPPGLFSSARSRWVLLFSNFNQ